MVVKQSPKVTIIRCRYILVGAATFSEGFVICFLIVPPACLGSMAAAVKTNSLGNSQKTVNKTFGTSGRPTRYHTACVYLWTIYIRRRHCSDCARISRCSCHIALSPMVHYVVHMVDDQNGNRHASTSIHTLVNITFAIHT